MEVDADRDLDHRGDVNCFSCGTSVELAAGERVGFRDDCSSCSTDLHVCRNCTHHDPSAYNECRESNAEWVADRERANRCDYFSPGTRPGGSPGGERDRAQSALDSIFKKG